MPHPIPGVNPPTGDDAATIVERLAADPFLRRRALRLCNGRPDEAEELLQSGLVRALEQPERVRRLGPVGAAAWVGWTMDNRMRSERRRRARERALPESIAGGHDHAPAVAERLSAVEGLRGLDGWSRRCVLLAAAGLSASEIGRIGGISPGTVRATLCRARARLRR